MTHTLDERVDHIERMVISLHGKVNSLLRAANITIEMELEQMADFSALVAKVEKIRGAAASSKVAFDEIRKQLKDLAEGMNDEEDQAKVAALATELDAIADTLPQAIEAGGSMGGITA